MNHQKIKFSFVYNRLKKTLDDGTALVQIRAYQKAKNVFFSSGVYLKPNEWDERNKKVRHTHKKQAGLNTLLHRQLDDLEALELRLVDKYGHCSLAMLKKWTKRETPDDKPTFNEFAREELNRPEITANTRKTQKDALDKLDRFQEGITFEELDAELIRAFDRSMLKHGLRASSCNKHHRSIHRYINLAIEVGHMERGNDPYLSFKKRKEATPERMVLNPLELAALESVAVELDTPLYMAKSLFLLSCYTGLRFSDASALAPCHLEETDAGLLVRMRMQKTQDVIALPISKLFIENSEEGSRAEQLVRELLKRRKPQSKMPFFPVCLQYYNRILKQLGTKAGLDKRLASHTARRTFATMCAHAGLDAPYIQKLLGHHDIGTTMAYIQLSQQQLREGLEKANWPDAKREKNNI